MATTQSTKLELLLRCMDPVKFSSYKEFMRALLIEALANTNRVKYVDDATVMEFVPRLSPSYLNFTVSDIYSFASSRGMVLNAKKCKEMCISFFTVLPVSLSPSTGW